MNFEKKNNAYKFTMIIIVTALVTFLLTTTLIYNYYLKTDKGNVEILTKYIEKTDSDVLGAKIEIVKKYLENYYVGELDEDKMAESAIKGYIEGIGDIYTEYLTEEEYEELLVSVNGAYTGIGIYMAQDVNGNIIVLLPIEDSPAEEADIRTGDIISKIDGEDCFGMDIDIVASKIKGEEGTKLTLEIIRDDKTIEKEVTRRKVEIKYIDSEMLENNIGYIQMLSFDEECTAKFKEHLQDLQNQGAKRIIIDLRNNGGGMVSEAITMSELFLDFGSIIMKSYDKEGNEKVVKSSNLNPSDIEVVLLVNENSASATEIFAAALKENKRAKIVGKTTFGKGIMQQLFPINSGGVLKITIEEFKTPNGNAINHVGISPDVEVDELEDEEKDYQLEKAIEVLKGN